MIAAQEARDIANQITTLESQDQLKALDGEIWGAAVLGKFSVNITQTSLSPCVEEFLQRAGYKLGGGDELGSPRTISW